MKVLFYVVSQCERTGGNSKLETGYYLWPVAHSLYYKFIFVLNIQAHVVAEMEKIPCHTNERG